MANAGPEENAEEIKRGASKALCQKGRPVFAEYRKAVTVWIEMAQKMASTMKGKYAFNFVSLPV